MPKTKVEKVTKNPTAGHHYRAEDITVLEGLEPVRKRPGMYIGTTGPDGLHHLIWEVFDNARDEAMGGFANDVEVALLPGNRVRVVDNGRGIPIDIHKQTKVSALETIMTTLHAGGKFGGGSYKVAGGLHGVGVSVVNALSVYAKVEVHREGGVYLQEYQRGKAKAKVKKVASSKRTGTIVTFEPDPQIFSQTKEASWEVPFDWHKIVNHLRQQAYLVKGMRVTVIDARTSTALSTGTLTELGADGLLEDAKSGADTVFYLRDLPAKTGHGLNAPSMTFYFEGGLQSFVRFLNELQKPVHRNAFYVEREEDNVTVEVSLQYVDDISARILAFANNTYNAEGGTHLTGFKTALTRTLNSYAKKNNLIKNGDETFSGDDVLEGLTAVISVKLQEVQFEGQTKAKLGSVEARGAVETAFGEAFSDFLEEHPEDAKAIIGKVVLALKARKAAKAAKDSVLRKGALEGMTLPGKLADCQTRKAEEAELFIVEGDSAGGSSKQGRDRRTQAILPLRGKILNVERARLDRMLASAEIKALVVALGTAIGDVFDLKKLRYHKIIIATDADVDGAHIRTLLLTLFYRHFRPVIEGGFLYIAQPPLYKIKKGKETHYAYSEGEKKRIMGPGTGEAEGEPASDEAEGADELAAEETETTEGDAETAAQKKPKLSIQRYKGLGEMNPEELWETTMDPEHRVLKQVTIEDAQEADHVFDILMGSEVAPRKSFIQSNAKEATLDI